MMTANGPQNLVIPINHHKNEGKSLYDHNAEINYSQNWKIKHWKSLQNAYRSSPFFEFYEEDFRKVFLADEKLLYRFNIEIISLINKVLGLKKEIKISKRKITHDKYDKRLIDIKKNFFYDIPEYNQVFMSKFKFTPNLTILDLLFNLGPKSINYIINLKLSQSHNN